MERSNNLSQQMVRKTKKAIAGKVDYEGDTSIMVSTGSTLLDLAISGGRVKGGGIPAGILVEIFGPSGAGKTVLLCEIAGAVQRLGGGIMFHDPEARLNTQFAKMFDLDTDQMDYSTPDTVTEVFNQVREWKPSNTVNGVFTDSLAALSTNMEMDSKEGDKMGMRRAKEFSEELRKTCRVITKNNTLMVASNQVRVNTDAGMFGQKYSTPGGEAMGFYASLRLRAYKPEKIKVKKKIKGKDVTRVVGVETQFEVFKSSIWKPYHTAPVYILFDYGIDDIRANLQYVKESTGATSYAVGELQLSKSMEDAIATVENDPVLVKKLKRQTIQIWNEIEEKFHTERKPKIR